MIKVLGIVGAEAAKFTKAGEDAARTTIREYIARLQPAMIVSGECHLGGVDIWAREEAAKAGLAFHGFPPKDHHWLSGYKPRNLEIARASDFLLNIVVRAYHAGYRGMRFENWRNGREPVPWCYHCLSWAHVKSGGCWTLKKARSLGKGGALETVDP